MAINLLSPLAPMPFGPERGVPIWKLSINTILWLKKQPLSEITTKILEEAWQLFLNEGSYAVMARDPEILGHIHLILICPDYRLAKLACTHVNEFVFHIGHKEAHGEKNIQQAS